MRTSAMMLAGLVVTLGVAAPGVRAVAPVSGADVQLSPAAFRQRVDASGNRYNIIADKVTLVGTVRSLSPNGPATVKERMDKLLAGTTSSYGATYTLDYIPTAPLTFNDPALAASSRSALEGVLGKDHVLSPAPTMVAEDFAFYQQKIPGFYFFLGTGNPERGITSNWHTETFDIDEAALSVGVRAMSAVLVQALWK